MRILVTGAEGFVGTHLFRELQDNGHTVLGVDKDEGDLAQPGVAEFMIATLNPDYVVHLAARYGRILCRDEPHRSVSDNAAATTELAAACAEREIPILYASSSEVYGDHGTDTITEDSELRMPTTIYGLSKRWGEEALNLYTDPSNLTIVRFNMLYGEGQRAGYGCCALATFIKNALEGEPFTVHRNATRSWLYIGDAVRALRLLIEGAYTGTFNCSNDREYMAMEDLAEVVVDQAGGHYEMAEAPPHQIKVKNYSSDKLRSLIGWEPEVSTYEGIRRTVEAQRKEPVPSYG